MYYAVIMAGGAGTRLWPLSRKRQPKQALRLIGDQSMYQHSVRRLSPLFPPARIFVVTNAEMASVLGRQTPELRSENFITEPAGRDSAPAAGLAAVRLAQTDPDAIMVMLTADHYIVDTSQFRAALAAAEEVAADGTIVTLGIRPTMPATGYGYIRLGDARTIVQGFRVYESAGFVEKPDLPTAVRFVEEGRYVWNSGMFVWRTDRLLDEFRSQLPETHNALAHIAAAMGSASEAGVLEKEWARIGRISIDYGIMEHANRVAVIPVDIGWSDIGSWAALPQVLEPDEAGNVVQGRLLSLDTANCFVRSEERLIATIGVNDLIIVDTPDVLLVCSKDRAEQVRDLVRRLEAEENDDYL